MNRRELLCETKQQADEWYRLHKPLIEAKQYLERNDDREKAQELSNTNKNRYEA